MSKTLKIIVSVAAMIAIPYAAPFIAGAIGVSGTIATIAIGAGLGAGVSAATGGDPLVGAITGGIGAGAGPLFGAAKAAGTAGTAAGTAGTAAGTAGAAGSTFAGGANAATNLGNLGTIGSSLATAAPSAVPSAAGIGAGIGGISAALPAAASAGGGGLSGALSSLGATAGKIVSNPVFQSVAPKLVGGLAASGGVANTLTGIQMAELEKARAQNENLYNTRLSESVGLLNQAKQLDPNYFGRQAAQAAITKGGIQTAESTRGLTGERLSAERRRGRLDTSRSAGSAFQQGYGTGLESQLKVRQAGLASLPSAFPSSGAEANQVALLSKQSEEAKRKQSEDIAKLFGSVIGGFQSAPSAVG
jgi:hypothetical protein